MDYIALIALISTYNTLFFTFMVSDMYFVYIQLKSICQVSRYYRVPPGFHRFIKSHGLLFFSRGIAFRLSKSNL